MKRIVVSGYYGLGNTGDEAVLAGMVSSFRALDDTVQLTVLSADPPATTALHGVDAVQRYSASAVLGAIKQADLLLSGGGSLLQDVTSARSAAYYFGIILMAELLRKPVMIYGQGIGPITHQVTKLQANVLLNRAKLISVRDENSASVLKELGVTRPAIHVTADPSFAMEPAPDEDAARALSEAGVSADQPLLGVSVRPWKVGAAWPAILAAGIQEACERIGATPVFLPMQRPSDVLLAGEIADRMSVESVIVDRPLSPGLAKALAGKMTAVVAMRLHALMFAAAQGTPMVALSYDPKVVAFAKRIPGGIPVLDALSPAPEEIAEAVEMVSNNRSSIHEAIHAKLPEWRREAVRNTRLALGLLTSVRNNGGA